MKPVIAILLVFASLVCESASAFEFLTGRGNGTGRTVVLSQPSASTVLAVPSAEPANGVWTVELGANRKFEIKEFDQGYAALAGPVGSFTCGAGFAQFGSSDLYAERTARFSAAWQRRAFSVGAAVSALQVDFGDRYDGLGAWAFDLCAGYRHRRMLTALVAENLNEPRLDKNGPPVIAAYSIYAECVGPGPYSVTGRVTVQKREKPQFGVGQYIDISALGALFYGLSTAPLIYGGGLELSYKSAIITYATSCHPTLGFSHTLSVSFTFGGKARE
ncbi:MAG: hypothetical protein JSW34_06700 [Candidatus Zixiibacteriota bacterium]|nr:MAG: hypothetical protein JSW34_06700 [candidate division Zixibacteria bacterium]